MYRYSIVTIYVRGKLNFTKLKFASINAKTSQGKNKNYYTDPIKQLYYTDPRIQNTFLK